MTASIDAHNLKIANVRSSYTTFHDPRGRTNIDVTLADPCMRRKITGWAVEPGATSNDHQLITFSIGLRLRAYVNRESRFVLRKACHQKLVQTYEVIAALRDYLEMDPDHLAQEIHEDITAAAMVHALKANLRRKTKPPWWNRELQEARKAVSAAARTLVHNGNRQSISPNRAPGEDGISGSMIRVLWPCKPTRQAARSSQHMSTRSTLPRVVEIGAGGAYYKGRR